MSKQAYKRLRRAISLDVNRNPLPKFTSVGCYPLQYIMSDGESLCADCVNSEIDQIDDAHREAKTNPREHSGWLVVGVQANWEDPDCRCANCGDRIESAYAEDRVTI